MINHLRALAVFAKTVDYGSFRLAAQDLQLSPSVVSHHVSQLEEQLGVALLYRSTRKLSLTRDGERLIGAARAMVKAAEDGIASVLDQTAELNGKLHVTAPAVLARSPISDRISHFMKAHPNVHLSIDYTEVPRDVIADGIDVAIRMGRLRDSTLTARKLYDVERVLLAARSYVKSMPSPESPKDLEGWDWLELTPVPLRPVFRSASKKRVTLRPSPRLSANNANALYELSARGAGLAELPRYLAEADLRSGKMQIVLPEWQLDPIGVYALRPQNSPRDGLAAEFVNRLARR
ncbi:MAG: LysR family transcriptional regulator [Alphaproteobacteria bacterium]|nr:LysR family transcriptional regulator [Alphaproteobacteria bacterium]